MDTSRLVPAIDTLPVEILRQVLLYFCPINYEETRDSVRDQLAMVSWKWRSIIHKTPLFWTFVTAFPSFPFQSHPRSSYFDWWLQRLRLQLERSGILPLEVLWNIDSLQDDELTRLVNCLMEYAPLHRWKTLHIEAYLEQLSVPITGEFGALETLHITRNGPACLLRLVDSTAIKLRKFTFFGLDDNACNPQSHPNLFGRIYHLVYFQHWPFRTGFPPNITHLEVHWIKDLPPGPLPSLLYLEIRKGLRTLFDSTKFPNLRHLRLDNMQLSEDSPIVLPNLRHLSIGGGHLRGLESFQTAKLESLTLGDSSSSMDIKQAGIKVINGDGLFSPVDLIIRASISFVALNGLFVRFPSVESLEFHAAPVDADNLIRILTAPEVGREEKILPNLAHLTLVALDMQTNTNFWQDILSKLMPMRHANRLKSIRCLREDGVEMIH